MKRLYRCRHCGFGSLQWLGRCPRCGEWDSFQLEEGEEEAPQPRVRTKPQPLAEIELKGGGRWPTGIGELDRLLGGGVLSGSVVLIGGEPGIGKSTLLLQLAARLAKAHPPILYISGEEGPAQVKLRAERLGLGACQDLLIFSEQRLESIEAEVRELRPQGLVVDSIQTVFPAEKAGEPGSVRQVGMAAFALAQLARELEIPVFLIGHITKSGEFAGPKAIEHLVDVVLYLEGSQERTIRLLRAVKNRYGSIEELGVFQMGERGLEEVPNPSQLFSSRSAVPKAGSVVFPAVEGTRPILVEIQALVVARHAEVGYPQRRALGLDHNRLALLLAVIEKRLGLHIGGDDVYLNTAGGFFIHETAADLGVVAAIVSSFRNRPIGYDTVVIGEVSLAGEVRPVRRLRERLGEAERLGYRQAVIPAGERLRGLGLELRPVQNLEEAMEVLLS
ncbi:MAG: DNA repair protein RadA [Candidatus Bipolaricaulia bacterium]